MTKPQQPGKFHSVTLNHKLYGTVQLVCTVNNHVVGEYGGTEVSSLIVTTENSSTHLGELTLDDL